MTKEEIFKLQMGAESIEEDGAPPSFLLRWVDPRTSISRSYGPVNLFVARMLKRELKKRMAVDVTAELA